MSDTEFDPSILHIGRSWTGSPLEDECPCPQEPCGLVARDKTNPECVQHGRNQPPKTMRQGHHPSACRPRPEVNS